MGLYRGKENRQDGAKKILIFNISVNKNNLEVNINQISFQVFVGNGTNNKRKCSETNERIDNRC